MSERIEILLAEDNPGDVRLIQEAFSECETNCQIHVTRDGEEVTDFLYQRGAYGSATRADLILLDLNLPNKDGDELLAEIADDTDMQQIPVIVLSSSANNEDISTAYARCANAYLTKPVDPSEFISLARTIEELCVSTGELQRGEWSDVIFSAVSLGTRTASGSRNWASTGSTAAPP